MLLDDRRLLGELLLAVADVLRATFTRAVGAEGLTFMEGRALRLAAIHGRQALLVHVLRVAPSRVSALLRTLERDGLVLRRAANGDRRQRDLVVTAAGMEALRRVIARLDDGSPLMTVLDADERVALHGLLGRLLDGADPPL